MTGQTLQAPAEGALDLPPDAVRMAVGDPLFAEEEYPDPPADGDSEPIALDDEEA